ncbi:MAG: DUF4062 domain-containing protein [Verrucomicrobiota bacterium]
MSNTSQKRLQVFVSSTYDDLKPERQAAVEAILTAGHIPAGMELFAAGDQSQMDAIKQWIDDSDVYMLMLGGRYGSIEESSGKSYTHLEFEYAISKSKPLFCCMIREEAAIKRGEQDGGSALIERENPKELKAFREQAGDNMVELWVDEKDIKLGIFKALSEIARRDGLGGWVRADDQADVPALADEVARLSRENSELRNQIGDGLDYCGLAYDGLVKILEERELLQILISIRDILVGHFVSDLGQVSSKLYNTLGGREGDRLTQCNELINIGLIEVVNDGPIQLAGMTSSWNEHVEISKDGKRFLNRYDVISQNDKDGD